MPALYEVVGKFWGPCIATKLDGTQIPTHGFISIGTELEFDGRPGDNLKPLNDEARAAKAAEDARRAKLVEEAKTGKPMIDASMVDLIAKVAGAAAKEAVAAALAERDEQAAEPARRGPGRPRKEADA